MSVHSEATVKSWSYTVLRYLSITTAGAVGLAILSQVKHYLPGNPVPFTMQVLGVLLLGGILGPRLALAAVAEYLLLGLCGLPVFAGWSAGLAPMMGATGGYLFGFIGSAVLYGIIYERFTAKPYALRLAGAVLAGIVGIITIYLPGWLWLAAFMHISLEKAFLFGVAPFVIMDILKMSVAATGLALWRKGAA